MLELPNFGHMTTSKIQFKPRDKTIGDVMDITYNVITFIQNSFILRRPSVAIIAGIIKTLSIFIKKILKDS